MLNTKEKLRTSILKNPELEERYQDIIDTIKKAAAKKENEVHDTRNNAKDQVERKNAAAAAEAESTLVDAVAPETERRSMKRSSKVANQRSGVAQHEHRRQDGWTSTPCVSDDIRKDSECDETAGERLREQRPHSIVKKIKMKQEHKKSKEEAR